MKPAAFKNQSEQNCDSVLSVTICTYYLLKARNTAKFLQ